MQISANERPRNTRTDASSTVEVPREIIQELANQLATIHRHQQGINKARRDMRATLVKILES
jgi:hypothetical protein